MSDEKKLEYLKQSHIKPKKFDIKLPDDFSLPKGLKKPVLEPKKYVDSKPTIRTSTKVNTIKKGKGRIF